MSFVALPADLSLLLLLVASCSAFSTEWQGSCKYQTSHLISLVENAVNYFLLIVIFLSSFHNQVVRSFNMLWCKLKCYSNLLKEETLHQWANGRESIWGVQIHKYIDLGPACSYMLIYVHKQIWRPASSYYIPRDLQLIHSIIDVPLCLTDLGYNNQCTVSKGPKEDWAQYLWRNPIHVYSEDFNGSYTQESLLRIAALLEHYSIYKFI